MTVRPDHDTGAVRVVCERCGLEQWNRLVDDASDEGARRCKARKCASLVGVYARRAGGHG